jgi:RalA-binding protein 1
MFLHEYNHIFVRPDEGNLEGFRSYSPDERRSSPEERRPVTLPATERRPSTSHHLDIGKPLMTPGIPSSPFPPLQQKLQEPPVTPKPQVASYEPAYETICTPTSQPPMGFPQPLSGDQSQMNGNGSGLALPDTKGNKARRRESSMMFMMGGIGKSKGGFGNKNSGANSKFTSRKVR